MSRLADPDKENAGALPTTPQAKRQPAKRMPDSPGGPPGGEAAAAFGRGGAPARTAGTPLPTATLPPLRGAPRKPVTAQPAPPPVPHIASDAPADSLAAHLQQQLHELSVALINEQEDKKQYQSEFERIQEEGRRLFTAYIGKCNRLKEIGSQNVKTEAILQEKTAELAALQLKLAAEQAKSAEVRKASDQNDQSSLRSMKQELETLKAEHAAVSTRLKTTDALHQEASQKKDEFIAQLRKELEKARQSELALGTAADLERMTKESESKEKELAKMKRELDLKEKELQKLKSDVESLSDEKGRETRKLQEELEARARTIASLEQTVGSEREANSLNLMLLKDKAKHLDSIETFHKSQLAKVESSYKHCQQEVRSKDAQIASLTSEHMVLVNSLAALREDCDRHRRAAEALQEGGKTREADTDKRNKELMEQVSKLQQTVLELRADQEESRVVSEQACIRVADLETKLRDATRALEIASSEAARLKTAQLQATDGRVVAQEAQIITLTAQVTQLQTLNAAQEARLNKLITQAAEKSKTSGVMLEVEQERWRSVEKDLTEKIAKLTEKLAEANKERSTQADKAVDFEKKFAALQKHARSLLSNQNKLQQQFDQAEKEHAEQLLAKQADVEALNSKLSEVAKLARDKMHAAQAAELELARLKYTNTEMEDKLKLLPAAQRCADEEKARAARKHQELAGALAALHSLSAERDLLLFDKQQLQLQLEILILSCDQGSDGLLRRNAALLAERSALERELALERLAKSSGGS